VSRQLLAILGLVVFAGGALAGAFASQLANPAPPASPWRDVPLVGEPAESAAVASILVRDDAQTLARTLDLDLLQRLASSIDPLVDIEEVTFTGSAERSGDILAAYVAGGKALSGERLLVGVVFRVRDGKVVGVN